MGPSLPNVSTGSFSIGALRATISVAVFAMAAIVELVLDMTGSDEMGTQKGWSS